MTWFVVFVPWYDWHAMRLFDRLRHNEKQSNLPRLAGGAPQPGERLCEASRYMDRPEAETAERMVQEWRKMTPAEYDAFAASL